MSPYLLRDISRKLIKSASQKAFSYKLVSEQSCMCSELDMKNHYVK